MSDWRKDIRRIKKDLEGISQILDACDIVVSTLNGNTYGLTVEEQLEALRMAAGELESELAAWRMKP